MKMSKKHHFEFISIYDGVSDYRVYELGTKNNFRISLTEDTKQVKRICGDPISDELLKDFNDHRLELWEQSKHYCESKGYETPAEFIPAFVL